MGKVVIAPSERDLILWFNNLDNETRSDLFKSFIPGNFVWSRDLNALGLINWFSSLPYGKKLTIYRIYENDD